VKEFSSFPFSVKKTGLNPVIPNGVRAVRTASSLHAFCAMNLSSLLFSSFPMAVLSLSSKLKNLEPLIPKALSRGPLPLSAASAETIASFFLDYLFIL